MMCGRVKVGTDRRRGVFQPLTFDINTNRLPRNRLIARGLGSFTCWLQNGESRNDWPVTAKGFSALPEAAGGVAGQRDTLLALEL